MTKILITTDEPATYAEETLAFYTGVETAQDILTFGYVRKSGEVGERRAVFYPPHRIMSVTVDE